MKKQREHVIDMVFALSLMCVFTLCGLLVVFIGVNVYKDTVINMESTFSDRTAMSFLAKQIRQNDRSDGIEITEIEGQVALKFIEDIDEETFCKYIYYNEGYLYELYAKEEFTPVLSAGQQLIELDGWDIVLNENGTITLSIYYNDSTEESHLTLSLRSES
ncbi:MAG: DUF4860 domain-containing protein [Eubacteriales bacterium]